MAEPRQESQDRQPRQEASFGAFLRQRREALREENPSYSLRQVAGRVGIQPSYLSQVERDRVPPPGEETMVRLARELELDPDVLLALGGKVSSDLKAAIRKRPKLFAELIRAVREMPDDAVLRVVREVRDGEW
jgi:transcriptional regulator with XRE-family HTH domain